jgi:hypothetical protein
MPPETASELTPPPMQVLTDRVLADRSEAAQILLSSNRPRTVDLVRRAIADVPAALNIISSGPDAVDELVAETALLILDEEDAETALCIAKTVRLVTVHEPVPIIVLGIGAAEDDFDLRLHRIGLAEHVAAPIDVRTLRSQIKNFLEVHRLHRCISRLI